MSLSYSPPYPSPALLARLNLYAVLPAFADLIKHSEEARQVLGERSISVKIQAGSLFATLVFANGRCRFLREPTVRSMLVLRFLTYTQLNKQFSGRGFSLPIPVRGARRVDAMRTFAALSSLLQSTLLPERSGAAERDPEQRALHVRLTLGVGLAAACELIRWEPCSSSLFSTAGDFTVQFRVKGLDLAAWVAVKDGVPCWGKGEARGPVTAALIFRDASIALRALDGNLDNLAAVNTGAIKVEGLTPLVDKLGIVFERVPIYLEPK